LVTLKSLDRKRFDIDGQRGPLVIPAEGGGLAIDPEGRASGRHPDPLRSRRPVVDDRVVAGGPRLLRQRQPMPHVEQCLLMHHLVLKNREQRFRAIEERVARLLELGGGQRVEHAAVRLFGKRLHRGPCRPVRRM